MAPRSCLAIMWLSIVTETLAMLGPAAFTTLRVWVLTGQQKWITGVALILSLGPFVVNVCTLYANHIVNSGPPVLCAESINVSTAWYGTATVASRGSQFLVDCLALIVTWRKTYETSRTLHEALHSQALSLSSVMLNGGIIYFCCLAVLNILDVILCVLGVQGQDAVIGSYVIAFLDPLSALLVCRFLLDLRGVSEGLARGSSGTGFSSLEFGGIGSRMPSIVNPSLLDSLPISVHVSPDLDEDEAALAEGVPDSRPSESLIA
ncbi:hypothetical protein BD413DRAFT_13936 [Trametes elegans]|nr:hypothetical protein BD413DRAFT_13936 [Trametes elegans]